MRDDSTMTHQRVSSIVILTYFLIALPLSGHAGDIQAGQNRADTCLGCHGIADYANAAPNYKVPKLGGQSAQYIKSALLAYRSGERDHGSMRANAFSLSDQEIENLAAYFASLTTIAPMPASSLEAAQTEQGDEKDTLLSSALSTCITCHGDKGQGMDNQPQNPVLAGQHASYIEQSLINYQTGKRSNPIMLGMAANLSRQQIKAVAAYYEQQTGLITPNLKGNTP